MQIHSCLAHGYVDPTQNIIGGETVLAIKPTIAREVHSFPTGAINLEESGLCLKDRPRLDA